MLQFANAEYSNSYEFQIHLRDKKSKFTLQYLNSEQIIFRRYSKIYIEKHRVKLLAKVKCPILTSHVCPSYHKIKSSSFL